MMSMKEEVKSKDTHCEACTLDKMQKTSCPKLSLHRADKPLELVHSDLCGPMQVESIGGSRYMLTFIDDYSRYTKVYFLKKKSEVVSKFKDYTSLMENMTGNQLKRLSIRNTVKAFRTDNGGEYKIGGISEILCGKGYFS